jgi:hypothetical protein
MPSKPKSKSKSTKAVKASFKDTYHVVNAQCMNDKFDLGLVTIAKNTYGGLFLKHKENRKALLFNVVCKVLFDPNESADKWYFTMDVESMSEDLGELLRSLSTNKAMIPFLKDNRTGGGTKPLISGPHSWNNGVTHAISIGVDKSKIPDLRIGDTLTGHINITAYVGNGGTKAVSMKLWAPKIINEDNGEGSGDDESKAEEVEEPKVWQTIPMYED